MDSLSRLGLRCSRSSSSLETLVRRHAMAKAKHTHTQSTFRLLTRVQGLLLHEHSHMIIPKIW
jgi:hypothetical protein